MTDTSFFHQGTLTTTGGEDTLDGTFRDIGRSYGYDDISADFASYKEFKSTWQRCGKKITFLISDYLGDAKPEVLGDFARSLFDRIARRTPACLYGPRLKAYLHSDEFVRRNQATYVRRSRNMSRSPQGRHYDLKETYEALMARGLVPPSEDASLNWTISGNRMRVGYCSVLMRVVTVSSLLDHEKVPSFVHEYVLYHELLHLDDGLSDGRRHHTPEFKLRERQHPQWRESEEWLHRLAARKVDLS
jgi:hypothetical protein